MKYIPEKHHRRSIRLKEYDYSQSGLYFITLCIQNRECLFGDVENDLMTLNDTGNRIRKSWEWLDSHYEHVVLGDFVIMPNHLHGIIELRIDNDMLSGTGDDGKGGSRTAPTRLKPLGRLIGAFKTVSTKEVNIIRQSQGVKLWQRNYYEHIIRDEESYHKIEEYIRTNPMRWKEDKLHD